MKRKLQVFVSSTYTDLVIERQAAVSAILKAGHIPAGMELFTAGDKSQMRTIEKWIEESDVYMLILGGRYGSIEPTTGLSYTELEFDHAISLGKPVFSVVIEDGAIKTKVKQFGTSCLETENPNALKLFRRKVLSNVCAFFSDPKDIKLCVHESMSDHANNPDLKGWIDASEIDGVVILKEEIKKLRDENLILNEKVQLLEKTAGQTLKINDDSFEVTYDILRSTEIKVPADVSDGEKEHTVNMLDLLWSNKETFMNGVTNSFTSNDASKFLYFNVFPKLHVHGLSDNEKVTGASYRRSFINKKGLEFLSKIDRMCLERKRKNNSTTDLLVDNKIQEDVGNNSAQDDMKLVPSEMKPESRPKKGRAK